MTKFARGKIGTIRGYVSAICIGEVFIYSFIYIDFTRLRGEKLFGYLGCLWRVDLFLHK